MFAIAGVLLLVAVGLMIIQTRIVHYPFLKYPFIYGSVVATLLAVVFATALGNDFPIHVDLTLVQPPAATMPAPRQTISFRIFPPIPGRWANTRSSFPSSSVQVRYPIA